MVLEGYVTSILRRYTTKYLHNVDAENVPLWGGDIVFRDVEMRLDVLQAELDLPVTFTRGFVKMLKIHLPLTSLLRDAIEVTVDTVEVIATCRPETMSSPPRRSTTGVNVPQTDAEAAESWIGSLLSRVALNIRVTATNVVVKFVGDEYVSTASLKSLRVYPTNEEWEECFVDYQGPSKVLRRSIDIVDLTLCVDGVDAAGQPAYEPPVLNRMCARVRSLVHCGSRSRQLGSTMPSTQVDVHCDGASISLSNTQLLSISALLSDILAITNSAFPSAGAVEPEVIRVRDRARKVSHKISGAEFVGSVAGREAAEAMNSDDRVVLTSPAAREDAAKQGWLSWTWSLVAEDDADVSPGRFDDDGYPLPPAAQQTQANVASDGRGTSASGAVIFSESREAQMLLVTVGMGTVTLVLRQAAVKHSNGTVTKSSPLLQMTLSQSSMLMSSRSTLTNDQGEACEEVQVALRSIEIVDCCNGNHTLLSCGNPSGSYDLATCGHPLQVCLFCAATAATSSTSSPHAGNGVSILQSPASIAAAATTPTHASASIISPVLAIEFLYRWEGDTRAACLKNIRNSEHVANNALGASPVPGVSTTARTPKPAVLPAKTGTSNASSESGDASISLPEGEVLTLKAHIAPIHASVAFSAIHGVVAFVDPVLSTPFFVELAQSPTDKVGNHVGATTGKTSSTPASRSSTSPLSNVPLKWFALDLCLGEMSVIVPAPSGYADTRGNQCTSLLLACGGIRFGNAGRTGQPTQVSPLNAPDLLPRNGGWVEYEGAVQGLKLGLAKYAPAAWRKREHITTPVVWFTDEMVTIQCSGRLRCPGEHPSWCNKPGSNGGNNKAVFSFDTGNGHGGVHDSLAPSDADVGVFAVRVKCLNLTISMHDSAVVAALLFPSMFSDQHLLDRSNSTTSHRNTIQLSELCGQLAQGSSGCAISVTVGGAFAASPVLTFGSQRDASTASSSKASPPLLAVSGRAQADAVDQLFADLPSMITQKLGCRARLSRGIDFSLSAEALSPIWDLLTTSSLSRRQSLTSIDPSASGSNPVGSGKSPRLGPAGGMRTPSQGNKPRGRVGAMKLSGSAATAANLTSVAASPHAHSPAQDINISTRRIPAGANTSSSSALMIGGVSDVGGSQQDLRSRLSSAGSTCVVNERYGSIDMEHFDDVDLEAGGGGGISPPPYSVAGGVGHAQIAKENAALKVLVRGYEAALSSGAAATIASTSSHGRSKSNNISWNARKKRVSHLYRTAAPWLERTFGSCLRMPKRPLKAMIVIYVLMLHLVIMVVLHRLSEQTNMAMEGLKRIK